MIDALQPPKVFPHSEESERAVLAAILLDPQLLPMVSGRLLPADFYFDRHRLLYQAMLELQDQQVVIDLRTLQARLEQQAQFEAAGGIGYMAGLDVDLPDLGRIEHYIEIVKERSVRRRLIDVCREVTRDCLDGGLEAQAALGRAEQAILSLGEEAVRRGFVPFATVIEQTLEALEERPGATLIGVPTGFIDFDRMTHGLNRGNLIIVAGRPGMGKTSFALNVAQHVAIRENRTVGVFSLEMSQQELALRVLCAEADIPFGRLRSGHLSQQQWTKVIQTMRAIAKAPLFIDDSASPSLLEVASKARRLKAERKLDVLIVDYLQLMQAGGRYENRNLEISAITRSLKQLAKELDIPVVVLSQLSRQPERRGGDHRPQLADLRECVVGDTPVTLTDGRAVAIRELVGTAPEVVAIDEQGKLARGRAEVIWSVGVRPVFRLLLASGRAMIVTANHRLLGARGWVRVEDLHAGDRLATARRLPAALEPASVPEARVALLAQLIGDGSYLSGQPLRYATSSEENSELVRTAAEQEFGARVTRYEGRGRWHQLLISGNGNRWQPRGVNLWLRELGVFGQRSYEKRVPEQFFRLANAQVALFLRHLWATDGSISIRPLERRGAARVFFASSSKGLVEDVRLLLLRFGIQARMHSVHQTGARPVHNLDVSGSRDQRCFLEAVGAFGPRLAPAVALAERLNGVAENPNVDTLPREAFEDVRASMASRGISQRAMATLRGTSYGGSSHFSFAPSRAMLDSYAEALDDQSLRRWTESDLFWDRLMGIEPAGEQEVFDLTIPGPASWLAGSVVSHNSGSIEQDSDLVVFIYRDEMYNRDEAANKNVAELIIAKHRNGETGTLQLVFLGETTRFLNLDPHGHDAPAPF